MPTSFLYLPLELRDKIYKLIIPVGRGANGEPLLINTDTVCKEDHPTNQLTEACDMRWPTVSEEILRLGSRLLRTCRQVKEEAAPYVYGQQQSLFYRPQQALE